jgi:tetratricopeptide (TPR) repeat protein
VLSLNELARQDLAQKHPNRAVALLRQAQCYPANLGEGKLAGAQENDIHYLIGCAHEALDQPEEAKAAFERASIGLHEPKSAQYYNDQPPDMIFYQGLALRKLGREAEARDRFECLLHYGQQHLNDAVEFDFFAVSLPDFLVFDDDLTRRHRIHCYYIMALGFTGRGEADRARASFDAVLRLDANHLGALFHRARTTPGSGYPSD